MSYENPQTVIDTESAKYYAQAISNLGLTTAKIINADTERKRKLAIENRKRNLADSKSRTKYNSEYISIVDKSLMNAGQINLKPELRVKLNDKIADAVDLKIKLDNFTGNANERMQLQNELNTLENLFNSGVEEGLTSFQNQIDTISELSIKGGGEDGLSFSHNNSYMVNDMMSTQEGQESKKYNLDFKLIDGAWNVVMDFQKEKGIVDVDAFGNEYDTGKKARSYNLNKDFVSGDIIKNPNITSVANKALENLGLVKGGVPNQKGSLPSVYSKEVITKTIEGETFYFPQVDGQLLFNKLKPSIEASVGGIVKQGRINDGDQAYGLIVMQSYVDDILPDDIDASIGILEPDPKTVSGINQEQFEKIALYVSSVKQAELNTRMQPDADLAPETGDELTANKQFELNETNKRLTNLVSEFKDFKFKRGVSIVTDKKNDIRFDSNFKIELGRLGFSVGEAEGNEETGENFVTIKSLKTGKSTEIPSKNMTDLFLKQQMYLLDGGNLTDEAYKNLKSTPKESNPYNVFKRD